MTERRLASFSSRLSLVSGLPKLVDTVWWGPIRQLKLLLKKTM
ncbi:hypothetical protein M8C21_022666 [Ambrosia artemisiifolia]|uniref:Uncharacterized protein n=1 Tax=Ambrosia artemisiifolia TaxID=4212 RepID=A0AAD5CTD5_AMBAR|nr:hypothetical protein M8C21_022666 [Ambrosia artemisiifolia]